jgi:hypothetical protein
MANQNSACDVGKGDVCPNTGETSATGQPYQNSPGHKALHPFLPEPSAGGPTNVCTDNGMCTPRDAVTSENGLAPDYYQFLGPVLSDLDFSDLQCEKLSLSKRLPATPGRDAVLESALRSRHRRLSYFGCAREDVSNCFGGQPFHRSKSFRIIAALPVSTIAAAVCERKVVLGRPGNSPLGEGRLLSEEKRADRHWSSALVVGWHLQG